MAVDGAGPPDGASVAPPAREERPYRYILPQGPITRFLVHIFNERLTDAGRLMFWIGVVSMGLGGVTLQIQIYLIFCVALGLFVVSLAGARLARVRLRVNAELPARTTAGARLTLPIEVHNPTRRTAVDMVFKEWKLPRTVRQFPAAGSGLPRLLPGETARVSRELEFTRRGNFVLPMLRQETWFPWGLWKDLLDYPEARGLLVYPRFHPLTRLEIPAGRRYQPGGIALSSNLGDAIEFIGTREYRAGDSPRAIHWRTWARLGKPAVKEFQQEYFCRVALLMDTFVPAPASRRFSLRTPALQGAAAFEGGISLSAAIADALSREEYIIDLFAAGPEIYYLQAGRSLAYLENVLDILACLEPCHEPPFEKIGPVLLEHLDSITTTIAVLLDWDSAREAMVRTLCDHGCAVKLIIVRDGPVSADLASAHDLCGDVAVVNSDDVAAGIEML